MSDTEEQLDDLHRSLLTLCGANPTALDDETDSSSIDGTVIEVNKAKDTRNQVPDSDGTFCIEVQISDDPSNFEITSITTSPSKRSETSEVETSFDVSEYDTVDEISYSENEVYTTTSEDTSGWSPPKSCRKFEQFEVVDETDGESPNPSKRPENRNILFAKKEHALSFGVSPIKTFAKDSNCLSSMPNTPSFLPCAKFAQSTPMNRAACINESSCNKNENITKRGQKKKRSIFEDEENDLSDMSFDELLGDTMALCQNDGTDWTSIFRDTTNALKYDNVDKDVTSNETGNVRKAVLKDWKMLYAHTELQDDSQKNISQGELIEMDESKFDETIVDENRDSKTEVDENKQGDIPPCTLRELGKQPQVNTSVTVLGNFSKKTVTTKDEESKPSISELHNHIELPVSCSQDQNSLLTKNINDHNLSKIKIETMFAENEKESKEKDKSGSKGRFSNFQSFILSDIETTEDEIEVEESEDLLGLNNFTYSEADDIDIDDEDEATLLDDTITNLPESIKNKYKLYKEVTIVKEKEKEPSDSQEQIAGTDINENLTKVKTESDGKVAGIKQNEDLVTVVITEEDEVQVLEEENEKLTDISKVTGKIDYEAERKYFNIESAEVRDIIHQWGSKGIQDPDMNLSQASNLHRKRNKQGMLEGSHLSCIWLRISVEAGKECLSPMKKRQKLDSEARNRQDVMKLEEELKDIENRYQGSLRKLWQEWIYERDSLEARHRPVFQKLKYGQLLEMKENYDRYRFTNIDMFKMNVMRLHMEHERQKITCRGRFNDELNRLKHIFQRREVEFDRNFNHRKNQLSSLIDQMKHVKSDGRYGHHVSAQFVKGPCRSNKLTRSLVEVYVPAEVAGCILREDEVVDSFYKYV